MSLREGERAADYQRGTLSSCSSHSGEEKEMRSQGTSEAAVVTAAPVGTGGTARRRGAAVGRRRTKNEETRQGNCEQSQELPQPKSKTVSPLCVQTLILECCAHSWLFASVPFVSTPVPNIIVVSCSIGLVDRLPSLLYTVIMGSHLFGK